MTERRPHPSRRSAADPAAGRARRPSSTRRPASERRSEAEPMSRRERPARPAASERPASERASRPASGRRGRPEPETPPSPSRASRRPAGERADRAGEGRTASTGRGASGGPRTPAGSTRGTAAPQGTGRAPRLSTRRPAGDSTGRAAAARPPRRPTSERPGSERPGSARPGPRRPPRPAVERRARVPRPPLRLPLGKSALRIRVVMVAMAVLVSLCAGRLFQLQALDSAAYAQSAADKMQYTMPLYPSRGTITDRNGLVLARSETAVDVTADPMHTNPECEPGEDDPCGIAVARKVAEVLVTHLGGRVEEYLPELTKADTRFVYLAREVPSATYQRLAVELQERKLYGVFRESNPIRSYPGGSVGANVVGFVNGENDGAAGFEYSMNAELSGVEGSEVYERDAQGNKIPLGTQEITPAVNGTSYQLTLDSELQWMAERRLAQQVQKAKAESGTAIMMNIKTGEVLAMANYPSYDASRPGAADPDDLGNRAVTDALEPGSVQKVLTFAALLDAGLITPDTKVTIPNRVRSGGDWITDSTDYTGARLTATGVMAKSANTGTVMLSRDMGKEELTRYFRSFGLGARTGIELPGESSGYLPGPDMEDYQRDQISFGQGLSMTPVQYAAAVAGLLNGGVYNPPTIVASATDKDGEAVEVPRGEPRRVISEEASTQLAQMLEAVTGEGGTGSSVTLDSYRTGGKTATAERIDPDCGCYNGYTSGYMGFAPAEDPQILTFVQVDKPVSGRYGVVVAGPVYKDLTQLALQRYAIAPSTTAAYEGRLTW
ncbi:peptidoglycan D,D-transpeptidase FtsI family protein [Auraticoccus monumenti]|uniref:Cell division protein FtsI (Penicillin-binding protein 3) n=1 Tax=Auraticoccus monumenti TaxID=675864 RepID=A0A1G7DMY8_9ACTN|nr:penicillin-binding protein 2 [Auraticoccus monumenti]SDE52828.1 cell division protein FtsI (penicillin-binding protein 3) [Auraticoccus monumenti]